MGLILAITLNVSQLVNSRSKMVPTHEHPNQPPARPFRQRSRNRCLALDTLHCPSWPPRRSRSSKLQGKTLVTAPIRGCCALQGHHCRVSGRISLRPHSSGTTRITVQRFLGTAQRLANPALGSTAGRIARGGGALLADAPACDLAGPREGWAVSLEPRPSRDKESARRRVPNEVALRLLRNLGGIG
jgi:hypothetical protein